MTHTVLRISLSDVRYSFECKKCHGVITVKEVPTDFRRLLRNSQNCPSPDCGEIWLSHEPDTMVSAMLKDSLRSLSYLAKVESLPFEVSLELAEPARK